MQLTDNQQSTRSSYNILQSIPLSLTLDPRFPNIGLSATSELKDSGQLLGRSKSSLLYLTHIASANPTAQQLFKENSPDRMFLNVVPFVAFLLNQAATADKSPVRSTMLPVSESVLGNYQNYIICKPYFLDGSISAQPAKLMQSLLMSTLHLPGIIPVTFSNPKMRIFARLNHCTNCNNHSKCNYASKEYRRCLFYLL